MHFFKDFVVFLGIVLTELIFMSTVNCDINLSEHVSPIDIEANFQQIYSESVSKQNVYQFWFPKQLIGNDGDIGISVHSLVDNETTVDNPVRFEVHWEEQIELSSTTWLLPVKDSNGTLYRDSVKTLCSLINSKTQIETATIRVTVSTMSDQPVNFTLVVSLTTGNTISNFTDKKDFTVSLFSPVFFKLKFNESEKTNLSLFSLLEVSSDDDSCITVSLQDPQVKASPKKCPMLDNENNVEIARHLTMSRNASVTLRMSHLLEGQFLVFVLHQNDTKCNSSQCPDCWNDEIVPMNVGGENIRQKRITFTLREKISNNQYLFSTLLSSGLFLGMFVLFPIMYCTIKLIHRRRLKRQELQIKVIADDRQNDERTDEMDDLLTGQGQFNGHYEMSHQHDEDAFVQAPDDYLCGILLKRYDNPCDVANQISPDAKKRSARRYFGTLLINAIFYILPAIQLIWIYQRVYKFTGNEDICYFNFRCLHPFFGITAFNHLFSNVGYIILGGLFLLLVCCDQSNRTSGVFKAMGIALMIQGVMSALYHTCPNHVSFQFDTCFMYITAMLCWVIIYQAQHPDTTASAMLTYAVVAVAVALGVAAVFSRVWYFWIFITSVHLIICLIVSLHLDSVREKYKWKLVSPFKRNFKDVLYSFWKPLHLDSFSLVKIALIMFNFINVAAAVVGHWIFQKSQDFASYLLFLFILNLFLFSVVYLAMKVKERNVSWQTVFYLFATLPTWCFAFYFYLNEVTSWGLSPAESRTLNRDCVLFKFFDYHDIWHFLSAFGMFLNFMFFYTLDEETVPQCPMPLEQVPVVAGSSRGHVTVTSQNDNKKN